MSTKPYIQPPFLPKGDDRRIFVDIYNRLNDVYANTRRIQSGISATFVKNLNDMLISGLDSQSVNILAENINKGEDVERIVFENDDFEFKRNQKIRVVNQYTWEKQTFTASSDQVFPVNDKSYVDVLSQESEHFFPKGSFVFYDPSMILLGMLATRSAFRLFAESEAFGEVVETADIGDEIIRVNLWGPLTGGEVLDVIVETIEDETDFYFSKGSIKLKEEPAYSTGVNDLLLDHSLKFKIPDGAYIKLNGVSLLSKFHVDPGRIQAGTERTKKAESIGTFYSNRVKDFSYNFILLKDVESEVKVEEGQVLKIYNKAGESEDIVIDQDQTITTAVPYTLTFNSKVFENDYDADFGWIGEAGYKLSGRLTIEAGKVALNSQNINSQAIQISGLELNTQEQGVSIANLFAHVNYNGGSNFSSLNLRTDINSAQVGLSATTATANSVQANAASIMRSTTPPVSRPDGSPLKVGDYWIDPTPYIPGEVQHNVYQWTGSSWQSTNDALKIVTAGVKAVTDNTKSKAMLYSDGFGELAFVKAETNETGLSQVTIKGKNILLDGDTTIDGSFKIIKGDTSQQVGFSADPDDLYRIWSGSAVPSTAPFHVRRDGLIKAVSGNVGGWNLNNNKLTNTNIGLAASQESGWRIWVGDNTPANADFRVNSAGEVFAANLKDGVGNAIRGAVVSTSNPSGSAPDGTIWFKVDAPS